MMVPAHVFCTLLFSTFVQLVSTANAKCPPSFDCGNLGNIHFPFTDAEYPECGLLAIHGCNDRYPDTVKTISNQGTCNRTLNVTPPATTLKSTICPNDIFYDAATMEDEFLSSKDYDLYFASCSMVRLPIRDTGLKPDPKGDLFDFISAGISIQIQISPTTRRC
ncbi:hypothetical protein SESBI_37447 [Sesbania bispinosa]|nr:hypothetical protein SESBI_37447 [Sesbania bispinosa]